MVDDSNWCYVGDSAVVCRVRWEQYSCIISMMECPQMARPQRCAIQYVVIPLGAVCWRLIHDASHQSHIYHTVHNNTSLPNNIPLWAAHTVPNNRPLPNNTLLGRPFTVLSLIIGPYLITPSLGQTIYHTVPNNKPLPNNTPPWADHLPYCL